MTTELLSEPLGIASVDGDIAIVGPDGLLALLSCEAATETGRRLLSIAGLIEAVTVSDVYQKPMG